MVVQGSQCVDNRLVHHWNRHVVDSGALGHIPQRTGPMKIDPGYSIASGLYIQRLTIQRSNGRRWVTLDRKLENFHLNYRLGQEVVPGSSSCNQIVMSDPEVTKYHSRMKGSRTKSGRSRSMPLWLSQVANSRTTV